MVLPAREQFASTFAFYSTAFHEVYGHWTGHPARLNREFGKRFGDQAYAVEELQAEVTAAFACAKAEISNEQGPDHAHYLHTWVKALDDNPQLIFTAAASASRNMDYCLALPWPRPEVETVPTAPNRAIVAVMGAAPQL